MVLDASLAPGPLANTLPTRVLPTLQGIESIGYHTMIKEISLPNYLPIDGVERRDKSFPKDFNANK